MTTPPATPTNTQTPGNTPTITVTPIPPTKTPTQTITPNPTSEVEILQILAQTATTNTTIYAKAPDQSRISYYMGLIIEQAGQNQLNTDELAYVLATAHLETRWYDMYESFNGNDMCAYFEGIYGYLTDSGQELGNTEPQDGCRFRGRGFVQITGRNNYTKFGIQDNPDLAAEPEQAAEIAVIGMKEGMFTGAKLSEYNLPDNQYDFMNARDIINRNSEPDLGEVPVRQAVASVAQDFANVLSDKCQSGINFSGISCR